MNHYNSEEAQLAISLFEKVQQLKNIDGTLSSDQEQSIVQIGETFLEGPPISDEDYAQIYDFLLLKKYIHGADKMRLASLILWDCIHIEEMSFNDALKWLQGTIDGYDLSSEWEQAFKASLMKKYYDTTCECIGKGHILPLG
jgi:hypothetical protein